MKTIPRIAPKRNAIQIALILFYLIVPLLSLNGNPLFRIDILQRTLFIAGSAIRVDQFYLVLLATLLGVILFLLLTVLVGRGWCGWLCPQTVLNDLAETAGKRLRTLLPQSLSSMTLHLVSLPVSLLFAAATLVWFMPVNEFIKRLSDFSHHPVLLASFLFIALCIYLDLVLVKRSFCKHYCPYGRFQVALQDSTTLSLLFVPETRHACIRCGSCVRSCPMAIDIREGFQIECINCGRCIDACRTVMSRHDYPQGLIAYRFGSNTATGFRIGNKTIALSAVALLLTAIVITATGNRTESAFAVQRTPSVNNRTLPDGTTIEAWKAIIGNRSNQEALFTITAFTVAGTQLELLGPTAGLRIPPNENHTASFFIKLPPASAPAALELRLLRDRKMVAKTVVTP